MFLLRARCCATDFEMTDGEGREVSDLVEILAWLSQLLLHSVLAETEGPLSYLVEEVEFPEPWK